MFGWSTPPQMGLNARDGGLLRAQPDRTDGDRVVGGGRCAWGQQLRAFRCDGGTVGLLCSERSGKLNLPDIPIVDLTACQSSDGSSSGDGRPSAHLSLSPSTRARARAISSAMARTRLPCDELHATEASSQLHNLTYRAVDVPADVIR
nr:hypothetical protein CFP56_10008 [Quercus suber]